MMGGAFASAIAAAFLALAYTSAWGTLIVAVPTREGFVVAADSRVTLSDQAFYRRYVDGERKLHEVNSQPPIVFAITGALEVQATSSGVVSSVPQGSVGADVLTQLRQAGTLRFATLIETALRALANPILTDHMFDGICGTLVTRVNTVRERLIGQEVLLGLFQSHGGVLRYAICQLRVHVPGVSVVKGPVKNYAAGSPGTFILLGQDKYTVTNVLTPGSAGHHFLPPAYHAVLDKLNRRQAVREFDAQDGLLLGTSIISAAEQTSALVQTSDGGGIGGPIHAHIITDTKVFTLNVQ